MKELLESGEFDELQPTPVVNAGMIKHHIFQRVVTTP
jgi:hypothetical protein